MLPIWKHLCMFNVTVSMFFREQRAFLTTKLGCLLTFFPNREGFASLRLQDVIRLTFSEKQKCIAVLQPLGWCSSCSFFLWEQQLNFSSCSCFLWEQQLNFCNWCGKSMVSYRFTTHMLVQLVGCRPAANPPALKCRQGLEPAKFC